MENLYIKKVDTSVKLNNIYVASKLISFYKKKKYFYFRTKIGSIHINKDLLGKHIFFYNGNKWICKKIDNKYYLYKPISSLKKLNTKERTRW